MLNMDTKTFHQIIVVSEPKLIQAFLQAIFDEDLNIRWNIEQPKQERTSWFQEKFCQPLYRLLIGALTDAKIKQIYLDERLRYAPHRLPVDKRAKFHRELLLREASLLTAALSDDMQLQFSELWLAFHAQLLDISDNKPMVVLAVGDCLLNEVRVFINADEKAQPIDMRCMYFNAASDGGFDAKQVTEYLSEHKVDAVTLSFFSFDAMPGFRRYLLAENFDDHEAVCDQYLGMCELFLDSLVEEYKGLLLIHNVCGLPLMRWRKWLPFLSPFSAGQKKVMEYINERLVEIVNAQGNALLVDEKNLVATKGERKLSRSVVSQRQYGGLFHTSVLGYHLAEEYRRYLMIYQKYRSAKVLLLDFDNTLWSGIMAEGEVEHYVGRQELLRELKAGGFILAAVSKNSPENIRWEEMILKRNDLVAEKISWQPKVSAIRELAEELNLGLNSFVFIDDNHHERAMVENEIPGVLCLDAVDENVWKNLALLKSTPITKTTAEAGARTEMYRQQAERRKVMVSGQDKSAMYARLGLKYSVRFDDIRDLDRVLELVERTNQFNTTSRRHSRTQLQQMFDSDQWRVCAFTLGDDFGDLGVVGVVLIEIGVDEAIIDSFIMSCRAMGFALEQQMLFEVAKLLSQQAVESLKAPFVATDRNSPCASLYSSQGFLEFKSGVWALNGSLSDSLSPVSWLEKTG